MDSFILDTEDTDPVIDSNFLLPQTMESTNLHTVTVDPETHARLEALLEAAGKHSLTELSLEIWFLCRRVYM